MEAQSLFQFSCHGQRQSVVGRDFSFQHVNRWYDGKEERSANISPISLSQHLINKSSGLSICCMSLMGQA